MRKFIVILFLTALQTGIVLSGSDPHDSLLFDGQNSIRTETYFSRSGNDCEYRVTYTKGNVTGTIKKKTIYEACGAIDSVIEYENGALVKNSVIKGGEPVKTGPESTARIELTDGSVIVLGPNTNYTLPLNVCDIVRRSFLETGSLWIKMKKLIGGGKFEVSTERMVDGNRGTEYTVEIIEENGIKYDITKVYEGSVEVSMKDLDKKNSESNEDEMAKLNEDLKSGKVTYEEFAAKLRELIKNQQEGTPNPKLTRIVEAGYMLKTDGKVLVDPVLFNTSEDTWFIVKE